MRFYGEPVRYGEWSTVQDGKYQVFIGSYWGAITAPSDPVMKLIEVDAGNFRRVRDALEHECWVRGLALPFIGSDVS
jgi:hypothetical protein